MCELAMLSGMSQGLECNDGSIVLPSQASIMLSFVCLFCFVIPSGLLLSFLKISLVFL